MHVKKIEHIYNKLYKLMIQKFADFLITLVLAVNSLPALVWRQSTAAVSSLPAETLA